MSDSKVFVFGSFTEDETRTWLTNSSGSGEKPVKKRGSVGSLNGPGGSLNSASDVSVRQMGSKDAQALAFSDLSKNDNGSKTEKVNNDIHPEPCKIPKENGNPYICDNHSPIVYDVKNVKADTLDLASMSSSNGTDTTDLASIPLSNGTDTADLASLSLPTAEVGAVNKFSSLNLEAVEQGCSHDLASNGTVNGSSFPLRPVEDILKLSDGFVGRDLLPRGLINSGNLCFLNATLQALLSCSPFVHLLRELRHHKVPKAGFPTLAAFSEFIADFDVPGSSNPKRKDMNAVEMGRPFSPTMFEVVLKNFTPDLPNAMLGRPRQEDAQEFLSFAMDQMHDELLKLHCQVSSVTSVSSSLISAEDDEWETVGPKNKSAVTRTQSFVPSELSAIFGGQLNSVVKAAGNKPSATIQPYFLLHLDIFSETVRTIEDALHLFSVSEVLEGYRAAASGRAGAVTARKSVKLQTLPKVLILHLMRFGYGSQGSTKLNKPVRFPLQLVLGRDLLASPLTEGRRYELVATVTHHGRDSSKGHYTADARCQNGQWLRYDDASVTAIGPNKVLHDQAYVLFYMQH